jgi:hypothetical protein
VKTAPAKTEDYSLDSLDVDMDSDDGAVATKIAGNPAATPARAVPPKAPAKTTTTSRRPRAAAARRASADEPCYFDLETIPDESRLELFGLEPVPPVELRTFLDCPIPGEVVAGTVADVKAKLQGVFSDDYYYQECIKTEAAGKNRDGVIKEIQSAKAARDKALSAGDERRKLLSTTPEFCRIVAMGIAVGDSPAHAMVVGLKGVTEEQILETFWSHALSHRLVGFNCLSFDLPVLFTRSVLLDVPSTKQLDLKPWGNDVLDLYHARFNGRGSMGGERPGRLKDLARVMGIPVPAGDVDGSQVAELFATSPEKVGEYVASDIDVTRAYHRMYRGYLWS